MAGMDRHTGKRIEGTAQLAQSLRDVLNTRPGTRVMLREYGSALPDLVDEPVDGRFEVEVYAAVADAARRWVPRLRVEQVQMAGQTESGPVFDIRAVDRETGHSVTLEAV
ncbi:MAG: GPW/gp25 family protein [Thiohalospira sp.]